MQMFKLDEPMLKEIYAALEIIEILEEEIVYEQPRWELAPLVGKLVETAGKMADLLTEEQRVEKPDTLQ